MFNEMYLLICCNAISTFNWWKVYSDEGRNPDFSKPQRYAHSWIIHRTFNAYVRQMCAI